MKLFIDWQAPVILRDASNENLLYAVDQSKVPETAGVYVFGRQHGKTFEALYVGKATNLRSRVGGQFKNLPLMMHLQNARNGKRVVFTGRFRARPGQVADNCLPLIERALIRYFLSEGHDLVNKQGTRISRHEITAVGKVPKRLIPEMMFVEK